MRTVSGIFQSTESATVALSGLRSAGFSENQVNLLCPGARESEIHSVPTSETEQQGMGGAIGGVLGGALGLAGGFELGIGATALIPGVGPVLAFGIAGAALLGTGGAIAGAAAGAAAEEKTTEGVPEDEIFFYEDALRQGRCVVLVFAGNAVDERRARRLMKKAGAESIDAARERWWVGLRDAEKEHYQFLGNDFERDQDAYRAGFEAAQRRPCRGQSFDEQADCLKWWYPDVWDSEPFRRGYERGSEYSMKQQNHETPSR
ncbi:MAG TPA: hypothetical protein VMH28_01965 [Candidatus Acidoferrales bacterium]|nr:hypothetical protein [Candidatus Acidoferrales bacterium]